MLDLDLNPSNEMTAVMRRTTEGVEWRTSLEPADNTGVCPSARTEPFVEVKPSLGAQAPVSTSTSSQAEPPSAIAPAREALPARPEMACHSNCTALGPGAGSASACASTVPTNVERARYCIQCRALDFSVRNLRRLFGD